MYEFPRLEVTSAKNHVRAQIVGKSGLAKKVQSLLKNQEIAVDLADSPETVNLPRHPDFVYWFLIQNSRKPPQILINFLKSSQAKLIIISPPDLADTPDLPDTSDLLSSFLDAGIDTCQIFINDIYGPSLGDSPLSLIWQDLKSKFVINLPDADDAEIYPIYVADAASAIIKISFSTQTYGRTFYITGSAKTTILSFSYRLREEVVRQTQKLPAISAIGGSAFGGNYQQFITDAAATRDFLSWRPETDLSDGLAKLVSSLNPSSPSYPSIPSPPSQTETSRRNQRNFLKKKTTFPFRRGFVFPLVLAMLFAVAILSLPRMLARLAASLAKTSPDRLARFEPIFTLLGRRQKFDDITQTAALNLKQTEISLASGQLLQSITAESSISPTATLNFLDSQVASLLKALPSGENRRLLSLARELIPAARLILTSDRKQTFLIVFQNSAELRPTGGFISALAFVTLQKGKILDIDYQSVYQLDSQLVGTETPPAPIKTYLGETNWLIRDANWSSDVSQSAQKLQNLIARATGRNLDGTVFVTTPAFQHILAKTGAVTASDGQVWNQLNLVDRLVYHDRVDPQTGHSQDPLIPLAKALEEFIKTSPHRQWAIIGALTALDHQDLLLSLPGSAFGGAVAPSFPSCPSDPSSDSACLSDHISIVDANLGVNKADYFVVKEHDLNLSLSDQNQISLAVTLRYQNSAGSSQYPAGSYRNYVRVYLPVDSVVASVVRLTPDGLVAVPTDNLIESDSKVIGWFMDIPVGSQEIFRLESTRPVKLTPQNQIAAYGLTVKKQPGTAIPTTVSIGYPAHLIPLTVSDNVTVAQNKLLVNHPGDKNFSLTVEFATSQP